mgnify:CR=1 FL=1
MQISAATTPCARVRPGASSLQLAARLLRDRGPAAAPERMLEPCAEENQFLLAAVPRTEDWQRPNQPRHFYANPAWMIELFMVMKRRDEIAVNSRPHKRD